MTNYSGPHPPKNPAARAPASRRMAPIGNPRAKVKGILTCSLCDCHRDYQGARALCTAVNVLFFTVLWCCAVVWCAVL